MDDGKIIALLLIVLGATGMYLTAQGKLLPTLDTIAAPAKSGPSIGQFAIAFVILLFVLTLIPPQDGMFLAVVVILGAMLYETRTTGTNIINTVTGIEAGKQNANQGALIGNLATQTGQ